MSLVYIIGEKEEPKKKNKVIYFYLYKNDKKHNELHNY
jgi:hypothetical protein